VADVAALRGVPDVALGNVVGSTIVNVLLIVGVTAFTWPVSVAGGILRRGTSGLAAANAERAVFSHWRGRHRAG